MFRDLCRRLRIWCKADSNRRLKAAIVAALIVIGIVLFIMDYRTSVTEIKNGLQRNSYGEGTKVEELRVEVEDGKSSELKIEVSEQKYEADELEQFFDKCIARIEQEMLGENESPDYVTKDLNLMSELTDEPVEISWKLNQYEVMNIYGEIQEEKVKESGTLVNLEAVITYTQDQEKQSIFECTVNVFPDDMTEEEKLVRQIESEIQDADSKTQTKEKLELPKSVEGNQLRYFQKVENRGFVLIVMAILIGILFYAQDLQNRGQELQKKRQQMMRDYPEIINKLTLFLGAGMTIKRAWRKVVKDYEAEKKIWGTRYAYEEMRVALREMESGFTEAESYERFGRHCNLQEYIRLGALLSQNMRKGTKGLTHILRLEAIQAFENRKAEAKKFGEEAGTKLLIPMFIMFAVVLVIVIVPAFLTMQV